jgi:hypothetical protein
MAFDKEGRVLRDLEGQRDDFFFTTGVVEHAGKLYLASTEVAGLLVLDLQQPINGPGSVGMPPTSS